MGSRKVIIKQTAADNIAAIAWYIESKGMIVTADKFADNVYDFLLFIAFPFSSIAQTTNHTFSISFVESASHTPITGRVFVAISREAQPEPRYEAGSYFQSVPFWGKDVDKLQPGKGVIIDTNVLGYPIVNLGDLPAGD